MPESLPPPQHPRGAPRIIPQPFIDDLLNHVDIIDVVGRYVQLKKGGANFTGLYPFHDEKSPPFSVSPTKQFYHCFGYDAHGSAIGSLMEFSGQSYIEAIEDLAQSVGMVVPEKHGGLPPAACTEQQTKIVALGGVMTRACDHYRKQLRSAPNAIQYLKGRGLTGEIAAHFGLGYMPDDWQSLEAVFGPYREGAAAAPLIEADLVIKSKRIGADDSHHRCDRFRDRIMFPIRNTRDVVIGFDGRVLGQGEPKCLNSPEAPLFSEGTGLYGLFEARSAIHEFDYVLIVEDYMDVVALTQLGFVNAVATLGTAYTPARAQKLLRQIDTVVFSFNGDGAGRRVTRRALEACLPHTTDNKAIRFLFLPAEHGPDNFVRGEGTETFAREVYNAIPLSCFLLQTMTKDLNLRQPEGRARAQHEAKPLLSAMPTGGLRLQIMRNLADMTGATPVDIEALCGLRSDPAQAGRVTQKRPHVARTAPAALEQKVLRLLMRYLALTARLDADARAQLTAPQLPQGEVLAALLGECDAVGPEVHFGTFVERLGQTPYAEAFAGLCMAVLQDNIELEPAVSKFDTTVQKMLTELLKRELEMLQHKMEASHAGDDDKECMHRLVGKISHRQ